MRSIKTIFFQVISTYYHRIIKRLDRDFKIHEQNQVLLVSLDQINKKLELLRSDQKILLDFICATNTLAGGIYSGIQEVIPNQMLAETFEIINILSGESMSDLDIVNWINNIPIKIIKGKSILLIGEPNKFYNSDLYRMGAKKITEINFTASRDHYYKVNHSYITHPSDLQKIRLPHFDTLLIPDHYVASFMIKHHLFGISKRVKIAARISLLVDPSSFDIKVQAPSSLVERTVIYQDDHARKLIHDSGFFEVISESGKSKKTSQFNYSNGLTVIQNSLANSKRLKAKIVTYTATKLPNL